MTPPTSRPTSEPSCGRCVSWFGQSSGDTASGTCRLNPPGPGGWPRTKSGDACRTGFSERPAETTAKPTAHHFLCLDFAFVADFPEQAAAWLGAAQASQDIPPAFSMMLADPVEHDRIAASPSQDLVALLRWAEQIPGFSVPTADIVHVSRSTGQQVNSHPWPATILYLYTGTEADGDRLWESIGGAGDLHANKAHPWHSMRHAAA